MERVPIPNMAPDLASVFSRIFDNAQGVPIVLTEAPTTANEVLEANQVGFYSGSIYWNLNGTVYKFTGTQV